jgi:hypothetical protein
MSGPNAGNGVISLEDPKQTTPLKSGPPPGILIGKQIIRTYYN